MKYIRQFLIILMVSLLGEILNYIIPLPIPGSIYGMVLMFTGLCTGIVKLEWVQDAAHFLISIMSVMFIPTTVGIIKSWDLISSSVLQYAVILIVTTVVVMGTAGKVTEWVLKKDRKEKKDE